MPKSNLITTDSTKTLQNIMVSSKDSAPSINENTTHLSKTAEKSILKNLNKKGSRPSKEITEPSTKTEKEKLILKIIKYQSNKRFGEKIKKDLGIKYTRPQLIKHSCESLEGILFRIRNYLNSQNMEAVFDNMISFSAKGYEDALTSLGYDITGFQRLLLENTGFQDATQRFLIERDVPDIPPSLQLVYIIASTTYISHIKNTMFKGVEEQEIKKTDLKKPKTKPKPKENDDKKKSKIHVGDII